MAFIPYFEQLAKQKRICPKCHQSQIRLEPSSAGNPNVAFERCDCGYFFIHEAPKAAQVKWDEDHPHEGKIPSEWFRTDLNKPKNVRVIRPDWN